MKKRFSVRTLILAGSLLLQLSALCFHSHGAAGNVDLSFDPGSGVNGPVNAVAVQPDGKVIIGGEFTTVKGLLRINVARLNADGSGDNSFNAGAGRVYPNIHSIALQSDGKALVGYDYGIVRLNSDGSPDTNFNPRIDSFLIEGYGIVLSIAVQSDGKVLVGGNLYSMNGANYNYGIVRLNSNGSLDGTFNAGTEHWYVASVVLQPDAKVLIGGDFGDQFQPYGMARLNSDGSPDSTFHPDQEAYSVRAVALQPDGRMVIGGYFEMANVTNRISGIARLNPDGTRDRSFNHGYGAAHVFAIVLQPDGRVLIGGSFNVVNGTSRRRIARLNSDGSLDSSFNPGSGVTGDNDYEGQVNSVALRSNGKVLIGGSFTAVNATNRNNVARLNADGSLDASFHPGSGFDLSVYALVAQSDGKVLVGGVLTFINGTNQYGRAQLNSDGSLNNAFTRREFGGNNIGIISNHFCDYNMYTAVAVHSPGMALIAGYTVQYDFDLQGEGGCIERSTKPGFVNRVRADGNRDTNFNASVNGQVHWIAVQSNGKVLVGGSFSTVNGTNRIGMARLNADGSVDSSFNPGTGANGVTSIALQPDGKLLIAGYFTTVNGTTRIGIARLNADGSLDNSFNPGTGADGLIRSMALQSDGKLLIGGDFTTVNGAVRPYVARLYGDSVAPSLNIARSNGFVIVSWPVTSLNFQLQETTNLALPNSWSPVAQPAATSAGQITVAVPTTVGRKFFRLKLP